MWYHKFQRFGYYNIHNFFIDFEGKDYTRFDEKLGVGGEFGAGEEIDYVLNLLSLGFKGKYFGNDIIYHPAKKHSKSKEKYQKRL